MWTSEAVRERVVEAAKTLLLVPAVGGPKQYGNSMPDVVREKWKDAAPDTMRWRRRASPDEIARMEEVWSWISQIAVLNERRLLYAWAQYKAKRGRKVSDLARKEDMSPRTMRWKIAQICQSIADRLNRGDHACRGQVVDGIAENHAHKVSGSVEERAPQRRPARHGGILFARSPDARPRHDPENPEHLELIRRLERRARKRQKAR